MPHREMKYKRNSAQEEYGRCGFWLPHCSCEKPVNSGKHFNITLHRINKIAFNFVEGWKAERNANDPTEKLLRKRGGKHK
jgi:hypothetical protein